MRMVNIKNIFGALALIASSGAQAGLYEVNAAYDAPDANTADGICADARGMCTLRAAIGQANSDDGRTWVFLEDGETYRLNSVLTVSGDVAVFGYFTTSTLEVPIITAAEGVNTRIIEVEAPGSLSLYLTRVSGGYVPSGTGGGGGPGGAGIYINEGAKAYLDAVDVVGNVVDRRDGGGIYNAGTLTLRRSNVSNNRVLDKQASGSPQGYYGGGLANTGVAKIIGSSFVNNSARYGGAIASRRGAIDEHGATNTSVLASTIANNRASFDGAAIYSYFAEVEIIGSTIIDNGENTIEESGTIRSDVAAISTPVGDAGRDNEAEANPIAGEFIFNNSCIDCHDARPIAANRYSEDALFAYIDSAMARFSGCSGACAQSVAAYLVSDLYEPAANLEKDIIFPEVPNTYIATSIVNNSSEVSEYKVGRSTPTTVYTLWGPDVDLANFIGGGASFPGQLTSAEEADLSFSLTPVISYPGIDTVAAKPIAGTDVWRESFTSSLCKEAAQRRKLASYNLSRYCKHAEAAGNRATSYRASTREYDYGSYRFSIGAWEDSFTN